MQDPAETSVKIKVGGRATLYEGTFLRVRCPVKKFDRSLVSLEMALLLRRRNEIPLLQYRSIGPKETP